MNIGGILILGIHQRAPADPRRDRTCDADTVNTRKASFYRKGLALSVWPSAGESSLASPVAKVRSAMGRGGADRLR
jgi:hypothetical protein